MGLLQVANTQTVLLLPRNIPIRLFLSASRTYNLPVQAFIRSNWITVGTVSIVSQFIKYTYLFCVVSVLFRSLHLTAPHFLPAFQSIPPTRTGTVNLKQIAYTLYIQKIGTQLVY
jgi:hypothetical protein